MRKPVLSAAIVLTVILLAALVVWADTGTFDPNAPGNAPGNVFTVINYRTAQGHLQPTSVVVTNDVTRRRTTVVPPYLRCDQTIPAGFVLKMRHVLPGTTISTNGQIVRGPYSGDMPMEVLHTCYKLVMF